MRTVALIISSFLFSLDLPSYGEELKKTDVPILSDLTNQELQSVIFKQDSDLHQILYVEFPATHGGVVIGNSYFHIRNSYHLGDKVTRVKKIGHGTPNLCSTNFLFCAGIYLENTDGSYGFLHAMGGENARNLIEALLTVYTREKPNDGGIWKVIVSVSTSGNEEFYRKKITEAFRDSGVVISFTKPTRTE